MTPTSDLMQALTWSLLHFLWQGAAITALAAAVMFVFRTPATRYLAGVASIALMFIAFGVTFSSLYSAASDMTAAGAATPIPAAAVPAAASLFALPDAIAPSTPDVELAWVAQLWLAGVCLLALRIAFGLLFLEQLRRRNLTALPAALVERCERLQQRLGITRLVRYCECSRVSVPAVMGLFRPVVLLPVRALTGLTPGQIEAVIAHELGHIRRFDVAVNFFQVIAETLFFFHPAVWWLNKRIRACREECCDDIAIAACGEKAIYARALATMETWRAVPEFALAATGGSVAARVARLLGLRDQKPDARASAVLTVTLVLTAALAAGVISLSVVKPAEARDAFETAPVLVAQAEAQPAPEQQPKPKQKPKPSPKPESKATPNPTNPASNRSASTAGPRNSYIAQMKAAGYGNVDVDELIAMKVHDVTPEYIQAMRDAGFKPDADQVIGMKAQGVTAEYITSMRSMGFKPDADEIIAMKVHDVTPEYVQQMRSLGFEANTEEIIALKVHDVTVEYRDELAAAGYKLDTQEIIEAKVMDITPEFINKVRAHGFKDLSMEQLIMLKNADVL